MLYEVITLQPLGYGVRALSQRLLLPRGLGAIRAGNLLVPGLLLLRELLGLLLEAAELSLERRPLEELAGSLQRSYNFV